MKRRNRTVASSQDDLLISVPNKTNSFREQMNTGPRQSYDYSDKPVCNVDFGDPSTCTLSRNFKHYSSQQSGMENLPGNLGSVVNSGDRRLEYSNTPFVAVPMQQMPNHQAQSLTGTPLVMDIQPQQMLLSAGGSVLTRTPLAFNDQSQVISQSVRALNLASTCTSRPFNFQPVLSDVSNSASTLARAWPSVNFNVPPPTVQCNDTTFLLPANGKNTSRQVIEKNLGCGGVVQETYIGYSGEVLTEVSSGQTQSKRDNLDLGDVDLRQCQSSANQSVMRDSVSHDQLKDEDLRIEQKVFDHPPADILAAKTVPGNSSMLSKDIVKQDLVSKGEPKVWMSSSEQGDENTNNTWFPYTVDEIYENNFQSVLKPSSSCINIEALSWTDHMNKSDKHVEDSYDNLSDKDIREIPLPVSNNKETNLLGRVSDVTVETQTKSMLNPQSGCETVDFRSLLVPPPPPLPDTDPPALPPLPTAIPPPPPPHELLQKVNFQPGFVETNTSEKTAEICLSRGSKLARKAELTNYHYNLFLNPRNQTESVKDAVKLTDPASSDQNDKTTEKEELKTNSELTFCEFWKEKVRAAADCKEDKLPNTFREYTQITGTEINKGKTVPVIKRYPDSSNKTKLPKWKLPGKKELNTDMIRVINAKLQRTKEFLERQKKLNSPTVSETDSVTASTSSKAKPQLAGKKPNTDSYIDLTKDDTAKLYTRKTASRTVASKTAGILNSSIMSKLKHLKALASGNSKQIQKGKSVTDKSKTAKIEYFQVGKEHKTLLKPHGESGNKRETSNITKKDKMLNSDSKEFAVKNKLSTVQKSDLLKENISPKLNAKDSLSSPKIRKCSVPGQSLKAKLPENGITEVEDRRTKIFSRQARLNNPVVVIKKVDINLCKGRVNVKEAQSENTMKSDNVTDLDSLEKETGFSGKQKASLIPRNETPYENEQFVSSTQESKRKLEGNEDDVIQGVLTAKRWLSYRAEAMRKIQDSYTPHAVAKKPKTFPDHPIHETMSDIINDKYKVSIDHPSGESVNKPTDKGGSKDAPTTKAAEKGYLPVHKDSKSSPSISKTCKENVSPSIKTTLAPVNPYTSYMDTPATPTVPTDSSSSSTFEWKSWRTGPDIFSLDYLKSLGNFRTDFGVIEGNKQWEQINSKSVATGSDTGDCFDKNKDISQLKENEIEKDLDKTPRLVIHEEVPDYRSNNHRKVDCYELNQEIDNEKVEKSENYNENTENVFNDMLDKNAEHTSQDGRGNVMEQGANDTELVTLHYDETRQENEKFPIHPPFAAYPLSNKEHRSKQHSFDMKRSHERDCLKRNDTPLFDPCFKRILRLPIDPLYKTEFIDPILNSSFLNNNEDSVLATNENDMSTDLHNTDMLAEQASPLDLRVESVKIGNNSSFNKSFSASSLVPNLRNVKDASCQTTKKSVDNGHTSGEKFELDTNLVKIKEEILVNKSDSDLSNATVTHNRVSNKLNDTPHTGAIISSAEAEQSQDTLDQTAQLCNNGSKQIQEISCSQVITKSGIKNMTEESCFDAGNTPIDPYSDIKDTVKPSNDILKTATESLNPTMEGISDRTLHDSQLTLDNSTDDNKQIENSFTTLPVHPMSELQPHIYMKKTSGSSATNLPIDAQMPAIDMLPNIKAYIEQHGQYLSTETSNGSDSQLSPDGREITKDASNNMDMLISEQSYEIMELPEESEKESYSDVNTLKSGHSCEMMELPKQLQTRSSSDIDILKAEQFCEMMKLPKELKTGSSSGKDILKSEQFCETMKLSKELKTGWSIDIDMLNSEHTCEILEDSANMSSSTEPLNVGFYIGKTELARDSSKDMIQLNEELYNDLLEHIKETGDDMILNTQQTKEDVRAMKDSSCCAEKRFTKELSYNVVMSDNDPSAEKRFTKELYNNVVMPDNYLSAEETKHTIESLRYEVKIEVDLSSDDIDLHIDSSSDDMNFLEEQHSDGMTHNTSSLQRRESDEVMPFNKKTIVSVLELESNETCDEIRLDPDQLSDSEDSYTETTVSSKLAHEIEMQIKPSFTEEITLNEGTNRMMLNKEKQNAKHDCDVAENDMLDRCDVNNNTDQCDINNTTDECDINNNTDQPRETINANTEPFTGQVKLNIELQRSEIKTNADKIKCAAIANKAELKTDYGATDDVRKLSKDPQEKKPELPIIPDVSKCNPGISDQMATTTEIANHSKQTANRLCDKTKAIEGSEEQPTVDIVTDKFNSKLIADEKSGLKEAKGQKVNFSPDFPTLISEDDINEIVMGLQDGLQDDSSEKNMKEIDKVFPSIPVRTLEHDSMEEKCGQDCRKEIKIDIARYRLYDSDNENNQTDQFNKQEIKITLEKDETDNGNVHSYNAQEIKTDIEKAGLDEPDSENACLEQDNTGMQEMKNDMERKIREWESIFNLNDKGRIDLSQTEKGQFQSAEKFHLSQTCTKTDTGKDHIYENTKPMQDKTYCRNKMSRTEKGLFQSAEKFLTENFDETSKRKCRNRMTNTDMEDTLPQNLNLKKKTKLKRLTVTSPDKMSGGEEGSCNIDVMGNISEFCLARIIDSKRSFKRKTGDCTKDPKEKKSKLDLDVYDFEVNTESDLKVKDKYKTNAESD